MQRSCIRSARPKKKRAILNAQSGRTKRSSDVTPKMRWLPPHFIVPLNYRSRSISILRRPIHISSWWKDIRAARIFANVVRTAPYGKYTARAQFNIGMAREKQGANDAAIQAYQAVVDKFPNEPIAVDAQYQIGYIWFTAAQLGTNDAAAAGNAKTAFQDFIFHYPKSEKAAQARKDLDILEHKQTNNSFKVAKFYDKQKYYRAAVIYYNEVIRQQPGSEESNQAKKRIDQLRAKLGDAVLQPAIPVSQNAKKKAEAHRFGPAGSESAKPGAPNN